MFGCFAGVMTAPDAIRPRLVEVFTRIEQAAASRDCADGDLAEEIDWLHEAGLLVAALPSALSGLTTWSDDPLAIADLLRSLGRASLPLGRLFEGHINAAQLIGLYGTPPLQRRCVASVRSGDLLGVWGADGPDPVQLHVAPGGFRMQGSKIFCSGLGVVGMAIISASLDGRTSLVAVDVSDKQRADAAQWSVSGMRATQSGAYDFDGLTVAADAIVGQRDNYYVEPYFLGGMYRMCAVQVGGLDALMDGMIASLRRRGRAANTLAQYRVGTVASLKSMAAAVTEKLARMVARAADPTEIAREAILAREGVERCIVQALEIVERTLGTEAHREDQRISRLRRDLSFYIRQAAVDERLTSVGAGDLQCPPN